MNKKTNNINSNAQYRKLTDHSHNSSTYHKKDGTNIRIILKRELENEIKESLDNSEQNKVI